LKRYNNKFIQNITFRGFIRRFRIIAKATINFVMSVRLPVRMEQLGSHWTDFHGI